MSGVRNMLYALVVFLIYQGLVPPGKYKILVCILENLFNNQHSMLTLPFYYIVEVPFNFKSSADLEL